MASFPRLRTNAVMQYPAGRRDDHRTAVVRFVDGTEQRHREFKRARRRWLVRLEHLSEDEAGAVERFFTAWQGRFGSFEFYDPWEGVAYPDCSFEADELAVDYAAENDIRMALVIRNNEI